MGDSNTLIALDSADQFAETHTRRHPAEDLATCAQSWHLWPCGEVRVTGSDHAPLHVMQVGCLPTGAEGVARRPDHVPPALLVPPDA